jgi:hypothetical protein
LSIHLRIEAQAGIANRLVHRLNQTSVPNLRSRASLQAR